MDKDQKNVKEFMLAAGQRVEEKPIIPDAKTRILRVKLLLEEVLELAHASGVVINIDKFGLLAEDDLTFHDQGEENVDLVEVSDAFTDIDYVNNGGGISYGIDLEPCKEEVHRSNMSKFIDGFEQEDGKWNKGVSYSPADLKSVLEKQK